LYLALNFVREDRTVLIERESKNVAKSALPACHNAKPREIIPTSMAMQ